MKKFIFCLIVISSIFIGCGGGIILNKSYAFPKYEKITLSILPIKTAFPFNIDSVFIKMFKDTSGKYDLFAPNQIRNIEENNVDFANVIDKMLNLDIANIDSNNCGLNHYLTENEIDILKSNLVSSNIILVPAKFRLRKSGDAIIGNTTIFLIDIMKSAIIYLKKESLNLFPDGSVRVGGLISMSEGQEIDEASIELAQYCAAILAGEASTDFENIYLKKNR